MKELSIEEKARAYDKAIERAKQHCADYVVETIFPELKESEDERIRKAIINVFASHKFYEVYYGASVEDILAWLEAQGEQKPAGTEKGAKGNEKEIPISAWSEEDEKSVNIILDICSDFKKVYSYSRTVLKDANKIESFLKSLKERYTWKPSDLPHWKKSTLPNDNTTGFNSDYFCYKGYCINYKELFEKLPKDD